MQFGQVRLHITPILLRKAFYHHLDHSVIKRNKVWQFVISGGSKHRNRNQYEYLLQGVKLSHETGEGQALS